ncbi:MAG: hypothetical protein WKG00_06450 [Polyangiaceae bacterium]
MSDLPQAQADPHLEAAIDDALDAYREALPPALLAAMAALLREELARHPVCARLLRQLAPPPVVAQSADVACNEEAAEKDVRDTRHRRGRV